jgi:hypothetical protein
MKRERGSSNKNTVLKVEIFVILFFSLVLFIFLSRFIALHGAGGAMLLGDT